MNVRTKHGVFIDLWPIVLGPSKIVTFIKHKYSQFIQRNIHSCNITVLLFLLFSIITNIVTISFVRC